MPAYSFRGLVPVVDPTAFVHPMATLIGDVVVGPRCYVGPGAALRGDFGRIVLEDGSNVQDNCVLHSFPGKDCRIEVDGHVGHSAVLHGCRVGRDSLVGIAAVVMDDAVVGEQALVAASSFVKAGFEVPARMLVSGIPARVMRPLTAEEIAWKTHGTGVYQRLAAECLASLRLCEPLPAPEPGRPVLEEEPAVPLHRLKAR